MKIVFMGTPDFAVPSLKILVENGYNVVGVVTATDKPAGRGQVMQASAVKQYALSVGLNVLQPEKLRDPHFISQLEALNADVFFVIAFRMLPEMVWTMPPKGCVNLHGSLLPQYRGAAPIHWAIINGETETGVTTFFIEKEIDTGNIIAQKSIPILRHYTTGDVHDILAPLGAELVLETAKLLDSYPDKASVPVLPQIHNSQSEILRTAPKIFTDTAAINWNQPAETIYNFIRGMAPYPSAHGRFNGKGIKIFEVKPSDFQLEKIQETANEITIGHFYITNQNNSPSLMWLVRVADGWLELIEVQLEGKNALQYPLS